MADININGVIVPTEDVWIYQWFGYECTCPRDIENALAKTPVGEQVDIWINSPGGSVPDGSEIYTRIKSYNKGKVINHITGFACSAASLIACAAFCEMSPSAQMMIHNASCGGSGDKHSHQFISNLLNTADESIANIYMLKSGKSRDEVLSMMDKETWLSPQAALQHGLIDKIMFDDKNILGGVQLAASACNTLNGGLLPNEVLQKCRNERGKILAQQNDVDLNINNDGVMGNGNGISDMSNLTDPNIDIQKQTAKARLKFLGLLRGEL